MEANDSIDTFNSKSTTSKKPLPGLLRSGGPGAERQFSNIDDDYDSDYKEKIEASMKEMIEALKLKLQKEIEMSCKEVSN